MCGATNTEIIDGIEWTIDLDTATTTLEESGVSAYGVKPVDKSKVKGKVVIPSAVNGVKVNRICDSAFYSCYGLTEAVISDGMEGIGRDAFNSCSALTKIDLGNVKYICANAFAAIGNLNSVVFPATVQWIDHSSFCRSYTSGSTVLYSCYLQDVIILGDGFRRQNGNANGGGLRVATTSGHDKNGASVYTSEKNFDAVKSMLVQEGLAWPSPNDGVRIGWSPCL